MIENITDPVKQIVEEAIKQFGEEQVDLHRNEHDDEYTLYIRFPKVKVTNENGAHIYVEDLFVRNKIDAEGTLVEGFSIARSTFTKSQFYSQYVHSHVPRLNYQSPFYFVSPCLGTGPIIKTKRKLMDKFDIGFWGLYFFEISKYVEVESLTGGPYIRLESVRTENFKEYRSQLDRIDITNHWMELVKRHFDIKGFVRYILNEGTIKFAMNLHRITLGQSMKQAVIEMSSAFIEWYNMQSNHKSSCTTLFDTGILVKTKIVDGKLFIEDKNYNATRSYNTHNGEEVGLTFKGVPVKLNIHSDSSSESINNISCMFNPDLVVHLVLKITIILNLLNYDKSYGTEDFNRAQYIVF